MSNQFTTINDIKICYETFGNKTDPAIFLLMGNSAQGIMWDDTFCHKLADSKHFIIRFDYRDTGLSSCIDYNKNPYDLTDLTNDVLDLMDELGIKKSHFVGLSMGGAIAQLLAMYHRSRVLTVILMMTSPDLSIKNNAFKGISTPHSVLAPPSAEFINKVIETNKIPAKTNVDKIKQIVENWRLANGTKAPFDEIYWFKLIESAMERESKNPEAKDLKFANLGNHTKAQMASTEPNLNVIKDISVPCLIIHGKEDPIFPVSHAEALAENIKKSKLVLVNDMGHALNPNYFDEIIKEIVVHVDK